MISNRLTVGSILLLFSSRTTASISEVVTSPPIFISVLLWLNFFLMLSWLVYYVARRYRDYSKNSKLSKLPRLPNSNEVGTFKTYISWGISNPNRFYDLLNEASTLVDTGYYLSDNLFTWSRSVSAISDDAFMESWNKNSLNDIDRGILWRRYILCCAAYHAIQLPGDFVECGVWQGTSIKTIIDYFGKDVFLPQFWGYDTFDTNPTGHEFIDQGVGLFDKVKNRFTNYSQVRLVPGLLPDSLHKNHPKQISFLHVDLNDAETEIAVLDTLFHRVVPGGVIILDDYEWSGLYRKQKQAEDPWFDAKNYRVIPLPTGQGLIIKR